MGEQSYPEGVSDGEVKEELDKRVFRRAHRHNRRDVKVVRRERSHRRNTVSDGAPNPWPSRTCTVCHRVKGKTCGGAHVLTDSLSSSRDLDDII